MKRPEGFDRTPPHSEPKGRPHSPEARGRSRNSGTDAPTSGPPPVAKPPVGVPTPPSTPGSGAAAGRSPRLPTFTRPSDGPDNGSSETSARRELKRAARQRRKYERGEVRRFTRRSRRRKVTWIVSIAVVLVIGGFVGGAVYSPVLALKTVRVEGASRVSVSSVQNAVKDQMGTPLALIDFDKITRSLAKIPLIRSFVTETVPPNTLVIKIAERAPIGSLATSSGFSVVDPAGVVIETSPQRAKGLPLIELGSASRHSQAFTSAVGVLLALPADLLGQVDTVTAQTADDVTLTLTGGKSVVWGSAEQSDLKARVLAAMVKAAPSAGAVKYDVSAPTHPVFAKS